MTVMAELYARFADAWKRGDIDELMSMTHRKMVFSSSVGPEPGQTWAGLEAVRLGYARMLAHDDADAVRIVEFHEHGEWAAAVWEMTRARTQGPAMVRGVDLITARDGLLISKDAYRKVLAPEVTT